ncbi:hypothetical protein BofuT4_uP127790.1 [Botrytis cinerea T4]|uniref:Uncharacterized protein n=1 Tax=Botryotinia fuckeliana (strain T4) TaxID=999810 RepID=G2YR31_BOTF4|nr:hypothetical protein BofuT4_uP127790.1 [Botrytis cinerea T4]
MMKGELRKGMYGLDILQEVHAFVLTKVLIALVLQRMDLDIDDDEIETGEEF